MKFSDWTEPENTLTLGRSETDFLGPEQLQSEVFRPKLQGHFQLGSPWVPDLRFLLRFFLFTISLFSVATFDAFHSAIQSTSPPDVAVSVFGGTIFFRFR